jgi:hypothetical protein
VDISWKLEGTAELEAALELLGTTRMNEAARAAADATAAIVAHGAQENLGRTSHAKGTPTPSAPGQPPALISGALQAAVHTVAATASGFGHYTADVTVDSAYALVQEAGGRTGRDGKTTLPARPYLAPAVNEHLTDMEQAVYDAVLAALAL